MADYAAVLHALVDAAFSTGGITDAQHTDLLELIDAPDPAPDPAPEPPPVAAAPVVPSFGQESNPYA